MLGTAQEQMIIDELYEVSSVMESSEQPIAALQSTSETMDMQKFYTKRCLKSLDCLCPQEANRKILENSMASDAPSSRRSNKGALGLVSIFDILCRYEEISMYYQVFPHQVVTASESQASARLLDEVSETKIIQIEVKKLRLSDQESRQLLVISDITQVLQYEKKKIKHNF